jgi:lysophospholipase L1-like esterase
MFSKFKIRNGFFLFVLIFLAAMECLNASVTFTNDNLNRLTTDTGTTNNHLLWTNTSGQASLWKLDSDGNRTGIAYYGPFQDWSPVHYEPKPDGTGRLMWVHTSGVVSLWHLDSSDTYVSQAYYGPYEGWTPISYKSNVNGAGVIPWVHSSGLLSLLNLNTSDDYVSQSYYGPYTDWTPSFYEPNRDGTANLLWSHTSGQICLWKLDASGNRTNLSYYGPYDDWTPLGYTAKADGTGVLLWSHTSGEAALWKMDADGNRTSYDFFGPFEGWTVLNHKANPDGMGNLLWKHTSGVVSLWKLNTADQYTGQTYYGPYEGWSVAALKEGDTGQTKNVNFTFLAFGDSITYGTRSSSDGPATGYPKLLEQKLQSTYGSKNYSINAGVPGEDTYGGLARFETTIINSNPDLILLMEGTNDHCYGTSFDEIENNLRAMISIALAHGKSIILATIPPVISDEYIDRSAQQERIEAFNSRIYAIAADFGIPVAQVYEAMTSFPDWEILLMDQLTANHPNDFGYQVVRDAFFIQMAEWIENRFH